MRPPRLHVTRDRATCRFDLTCRQTAALDRLQAEIAERHVRAARGDAGVAPFLFLAEFSACGLQHAYSPLPSLLPSAAGTGVATLRTRLTAGPFGASLAGTRHLHVRRGGDRARVDRLVGAIGTGRGAQRTLAHRSRTARARTATRRARRAARTRTATVAAVVFGARRRVDVRRFAIGETVTAIDPALDADDAVRGLRFRKSRNRCRPSTCGAARDLRGTTHNARSRCRSGAPTTSA